MWECSRALHVSSEFVQLSDSTQRERAGWSSLGGLVLSARVSRAESSQRKKSLHPTSSQISNSLSRDLWINLADIQLKDGELNWARSWRCIAGLSKLVFWASWRSTESGNALKVDVVTENIYLMFEFYINFLCAAKAGERHSALVLNIGTFTEE